jgi:MtN3 and saliva related transmembrane protein
MEFTEIMGLVGAFLSSITFIPQVVLTWKTKSAKDLSLNMLLIILTSTIVWLVYAIPLNLIPVIIANSIILVLSSWLIYFKLSHKEPKN